MSTTHIQPLPNVRGRMSYTELGEGKKRTENIREKTDRIAAQMGDMGTREDFIRFCSAMRRQSHGTRLNEGYELRVSWSPEELSKDSPEDIQRACEYGYALPYDSQYFQMIIPQMGGKVWNETGDALGCIEDGTLAKGLQMLQDQVNNKTLYYGPTQDSSSTCRALFLDKKCAMYLHSVSNLAKIDSSADFNYQVAFVPAGERASVNTGGCTVTMLSSSEYKDACWEFLQWFITSDEGAVQICTQIGYLPFTYSMTESDAIKDLWERIPGSKTAFDEADQIGEDSRNANTGDCLNTFMGAMEAVLYDNEDVNTVVTNLDQEVKNIIG